MSISLIGRHFHITGVVQGVGFRPHVYGLADRFGVAGWVLNNSSGVEIEAYGCQKNIEEFARTLAEELPPLAVIDQLLMTQVAVPPDVIASFTAGVSAPGFDIRHSASQKDAFVPISPDIATCEDCLAELIMPGDRRFGYPFINCTNCGPRFTILRDIPYDRPLTTMSRFTMCEMCQAEYDDPTNRRFHAQPNACPECGPNVDFVWSSVHRRSWQIYDSLASLSRHNAIQMTRRVLAQGGIVAVKGLGGFHLACDATNDSALRRLRQRKGRVDKPFAVMARDIHTVQTFAQMSDAECTLLASRQRPIVLLRQREDFPLSPWIAPGNETIGVMLPYTPLHHLLLTDTGIGEPDAGSSHVTIQQPSVLVMTSGNLSEEPIVKDNDEAIERLSPLADALLLHDREIHIHCDDSVIRVLEDELLPVRRARGYAPFPVRLPFSSRPVLAVGGELKNTFCLAQQEYAFMSQHIGDMENVETLRAFEHAIHHFRTIFRNYPEVIACDLHPGYLSTRWAETESTDLGFPLVHVQHHHAHIAAVMAEHSLDSGTQVIGVCFDGTGYGPDGTIWGGEVLIAGYESYTRLARLRPVPLPGGDTAIRRPYRTALAHLWAAGVDWHDGLPPVLASTSIEQSVIQHQLETGLNSADTSSMGRLFDAIASLANGRQTVTYEGQAAIELENLIAHNVQARYSFSLNPVFPGLQSDHSDLQFEIDSSEVIREVAADVMDGIVPSVIAAKFHNAVVEIVAEAIVQLAPRVRIEQIALSGGVFQNATLLVRIARRLHELGFQVLVHRMVPPNDGGIALGQAVVAHHKAACTGKP